MLLTALNLPSFLPARLCLLHAKRALCYLTKQLAEEYAPDSVSTLVGGFIMLRFINPSLITPESYSLSRGLKPSARARRNLTLISKFLQVR